LTVTLGAVIAACGIDALTSLSHPPTSRRESTTVLLPTAAKTAKGPASAPGAAVASATRVAGLPAERADALARILHGETSDRTEPSARAHEHDHHRVNEFLRRIRSGKSPAVDTQNVSGNQTGSQTMDVQAQREFADRLRDALRARLAENPAPSQAGGNR
jgi:hypothetical protein